MAAGAYCIFIWDHRLESAGGTVRVSPGTYTPQDSQAGISFLGRDIRIIGEPGAVLNCGGGDNGFVANSSEPATAVRRNVGCYRKG